MKKVFIFLLSTLSFLSVNAANYELCTSGTVGPNTGASSARFTTDGGATCTLNPSTITYADGDQIYIPAGTTLTVTSNWAIATDINFIVEGNLTFDNGKLTLSANSAVILLPTSNLSCIGGCGSNDKIDIGGLRLKGDDIETANSEPKPSEINETGFGQPLPIELKSFEASRNAKNISLDWVTAKEENFSHFEVERSLNQNKWAQIGLVQGLGESNSDMRYDFIDRNAPHGVIYYRLKSVDIDASFEYSPVVKIEIGFEGKLAVSPNPVKDASKLKIQVPSEFKEDLAYVGLFDLSGMKIQEFSDFKTDGTVQIEQKLKAGMYILKVNHNGLQENMRVIVQ